MECKIFLEFSKTVATLPDHKCPGPKPSETEICFQGLCDGEELTLGENNKPNTEPLTMVQGDALVQSEPVNALSLRIDRNDLESKEYVWKDVGFTDCSEKCLGGKACAGDLRASTTINT